MLQVSVTVHAVHMASVFSNDIQSVTGRNLANIQNLFNLDPRKDPVPSFKEAMVGHQTPDSDTWRLPLLRKLMEQRRELSACEEDVANIDELIESLCVS